MDEFIYIYTNRFEARYTDRLGASFGALSLAVLVGLCGIYRSHGSGTAKPSTGFRYLF
jgi:hypothetical protein